MFFISIFIFVAAHHHDGDEGIDFTCINSQPLYKKFTKVNLIGAGPGTVPIEFIRYQDTGRNQMKMPKGKRISIGTDVEVREIKPKTKRSGEVVRNGVFACTTWQNGQQIVIPVFSHLKTNSKQKSRVRKYGVTLVPLTASSVIKR